jgi:cullin 1
MASSSKTITILPTPNTLEESWNLLREGTDQMMTRLDEGMTYAKYMQLYTFVHSTHLLFVPTIDALTDSE